MGTAVLIMGINGAGKTTLALNAFPSHHRLNRDEIGGTMNGLGMRLAEAIAAGHKNIVLDNTFLNRKARQPVIEAARKAGYRVELVWLKTTLEDAQVNACLRMLDRYGKLLCDEEMKGIKDPNLFPNKALYAAAKQFEEPELSEGIDLITQAPFTRTWGPEYRNRGFIFDYDDTLRELVEGHEGEKYPTQRDHIRIMKDRIEVLKYLKYVYDDAVFLGASNQSGVAKGILTKDRADDLFSHTNSLLGFDIDVLYCPHASGPPSCFCRKPHPGMLVHHIWKYKLDPTQSIFVGDQTTDKTCAKRVGMAFEHESKFFADYMQQIREG